MPARLYQCHYTRRSGGPALLFGQFGQFGAIVVLLLVAMLVIGANAQMPQNTSACPKRTLKPFCKTVIDYSIDESATCTFSRDAMVRVVLASVAVHDCFSCLQ
jgi:hypothetical protein